MDGPAQVVGPDNEATGQDLNRSVLRTRHFLSRLTTAVYHLSNRPTSNRQSVPGRLEVWKPLGVLIKIDIDPKKSLVLLMITMMIFRWRPIISLNTISFYSAKCSHISQSIWCWFFNAKNRWLLSTRKAVDTIIFVNTSRWCNRRW